MPYVVAVAAVCPMRGEPYHRSEMVSQMLFGEVGEVLAEEKQFTRIKCLYDGYEGWCAKNQLAEIEDKKAFEPIGYTTARGSHALINNTTMPLALASPVFAGTRFGSYVITFPDGAFEKGEPYSANQASVNALAYQYLNTPYLWGGKSNYGIDCSGFTQQVFKLVHTVLLRDAYQQATQGQAVGFLQEAQCGDLAFFDNEEGRITHVGILLDAEHIIHASGYVRVDKIDNQGIIHSVTGRRTHKLRIIKRLLDA